MAPSKAGTPTDAPLPRLARQLRAHRILPGDQQAPEILGRQGPTEEKSLALVALVRAQERQLFACLDAFGDHALLEISPHADHRADDGRRIRIGSDVAHEGAVDLQGVDREALQVTQARIAGTEVVDGKFRFPDLGGVWR